MLRNYLKIALRSLKKHRGASFINITGLAVGMACCIVILLFVRDETGYDDYHANGDRLYRLSLEVWQLSVGERNPNAASSLLWAPTLRREYPEVEDYTRFVRLVDPGTPWTLTRGGRSFEEAGILHADASVFRLFSWPLLQGDAEAALARRNGIVLTASMARKYFGDEDPLGQTITIDPRRRGNDGVLTGQTYDYTVTGVMADVPRNSHFTFDFLLPFVELSDVYGGDVIAGTGMDTWFWRGRIAYTYLLLAEGADPASLEAKLPGFLDTYVGEETRSRGYDYHAFLQPIDQIYLDGDFTQQLQPVGDMNNLYMFSIVAVFILLIACINFMNFSTARSGTRAQEVGMRKVAGAGRGQLVRQFLGESIVTSLIALVLALGLARLALPVFYAYLGKAFAFDPADGLFLVGVLLLIGLAVGVLAGSYPAFYLSRFRPALVLKGGTPASSRSALLRKGLVVFQFTVSTFLIVATLTVYRQLGFMRSYNLGFDQERLLVLEPNLTQSLRGNYEAFKAELLQHPGVAEVTAASALPGMGGSGDIYGEIGRPANEGVGVYEVFVDYNYFGVLGLELVAGRLFSEDITTDAVARDEEGNVTVAMVVNEELVRQFGWASPEDALGRRIVRDPASVDFTATVIGVMKDYHVQSLREPLVPLGLAVWPRYNYIGVRVQPGGLAETVGFVEATAARFAPGLPFEYAFLDADFAAQYEREERLGEVFTYVSFLAILIACLGLFGLVAFTAERRTKEIGIRKVLGASVSGIILLLSQDFVKLLVVAFAVAVPAAYFAADGWLQGFAYRVDLGVWLFAGAGLISLSIALLTISYQALKAAVANPVKALRYE